MKTLLSLLLLQSALFASTKYPADISYMIADVKYSQEHGIKICEVQHGILSTFVGDIFLNGNQGTICPKIEQVLAEFPIKKWAIKSQVAFPPLQETLNNSPEWDTETLFRDLIYDPEFIRKATVEPQDAHDISSYYGMILTRPNDFDYDDFHKTYPSILMIDSPSHPYWKDKYKMSELFTRNETLSKVKPEWKLYPKPYTPTLADEIIKDIPADAYVIKPRSAFLGHGVIIVAKEELDATLQYILSRSEALVRNSDRSYSYWALDRHNSFIVEKYYPSDLIQVDAFEGKTFEPTMRVAFILVYNNSKIDFHFLGGYWLLPYKSLDDEASLNEKKKAYCKAPFFTTVSQDILQTVEQQLEASMPLLYQEMLLNE